jgi:hypothetical protein
MSSLLDYIRSVLKTDVPENVQTKLSGEWKPSFSARHVPFGIW